jgi:hypothetical protein
MKAIKSKRKTHRAEDPADPTTISIEEVRLLLKKWFEEKHHLTINVQRATTRNFGRTIEELLADRISFIADEENPQARPSIAAKIFSGIMTIDQPNGMCLSIAEHRA